MTSEEYFFKEGCYITELHNTAADPAVSVARARVAPGCVTRWHRLTGIRERYLILTGTGQVEIGDETPRTVGPGDTVLIESGIRQRIANIGASDLLFLAVCTPRFVGAAYVDVEDEGGLTDRKDSSPVR